MAKNIATSPPANQTVAILGDGQMALAMAEALAFRNVNVRMWGPEPAHALTLERQRESFRLPGFRLPNAVVVTADAKVALDGAMSVLSAIPTQYLRSAWNRVAQHVPSGASIISVTKGIENQTLLRPTEVIAEGLSAVGYRLSAENQRARAGSHLKGSSAVGCRPITKSREPQATLCALSGPSIAAELVQHLPASLVAAATDLARAEFTQELLRVPWLRIYSHDDVIGVEVAAASKNVIALAAGMIDGLHAGYNAKSALLARGLSEIARLGVAMGAKLDTFFGVAGVGDLATTCFSPQGRNRTCGERLAKGESLDEIIQSTTSVIEGVDTARSILELARRHHVDMPITAAVHAILFEGLKPRDAIKELMQRELKAEHVG